MKAMREAKMAAVTDRRNKPELPTARISGTLPLTTN
jgi:hypothetical protein